MGKVCGKSRRMSEWGDEEDTGRGFGNGYDHYKDNGEENIANEENEYNDIEIVDDGTCDFGNRRGRGGGRGGRGGRGDRHGGGYGGGRRNNEENAKTTEFKSTANSIVPNNFLRSTVEKFLPEVPSLVQRTNSLVELYCIVKYVLKAYNIYLSTEISNKDPSEITASGAAAEEEFDQEYFNELGGEIYTSANENVEMSDLIGDKSKASSHAAFPEDIDSAPLHQSQLSNLSELFNDSMHAPESLHSVAPRRSLRSKSKRCEVVRLDCQRPSSRIARPSAILNIRSYVTESEYALRKRLPMRRFLKIVDNAVPTITLDRKITYSFFELERGWANAVMPNTNGEIINPQMSIGEKLDEGSVFTSSVNDARQHVSSLSLSGPTVMQMTHSQFSDGIFDTVEEIRDALPQHAETTGLQGSTGLPELLADDTFFTPDAIQPPANILTFTDENQFGSSTVPRSTQSRIASVPQSRIASVPQSRIATLPSIREEEFQRKILRRTLRGAETSSTPFRHLDDRVSNDLLTLQNEANDGSTELAFKPISRSLQLEARGGPHSIAEVSEDLPPRNWFDVLRKRKTNLHYVGVVPQRRKKRHHVPIRPTATRPVENIRDEIAENISILQAQLPIGNSFGIAPAEVHAECYMTEDVTHNSNQVEKTQQAIMQQPSPERFVFEHIESISTITDNLTEWKRLLQVCNQKSAAFLSSTYAYDVNALLDTDVEVLQIKMNILQEIIRNVSFNITKKSWIKNKRLAAVAFYFLVELQTAGIIQLNDNGQFVGLI
ncbi:uncharacterized protein LOC128865008 isoform X2 [Anastrepha ludens]|uniref:uncharacterized protein LOC128865008 isoform X2 n=2 Tax=Anastrepha ludens TaxID=28586 RepID=UPI0023AF1867|nr:uncharacterized protein LOC128865008 isoform X2 [Anastrepha ludens]